MKTIVDRIFRLTEEPILTPQNLLSNVKLEHYTSVNYTYENEGIKCTMIGLGDNEIIRYTYQFDQRDYLIKSEAQIGDDIEVLFDRKKELEELIFALDKKKKFA